MNMEKQEEEKHTASDSPSVDEPPSPHPHQEHNSLPPPESSPADSPISYRTSHGFSPKEYKTPPTPPTDMPATSPSPVVVVNRSVRDEPRIVTKVDLGAVDGIASIGVEERGGASARRGKLSLSIPRRPKRERAVERAALGFRVCGFLFCLVSFSIMASDKNQGWTLDSFDRYKEFRYCLAVNVIGFVYSGLQGCDLAYHLGTRQHALRQHLRYHLDFFMDQVLTYLLISASSSAATRVEDWQSNWGKDKFPEMARASVWMSFLAFVAFAASSLISGYFLFTFRPI